MSYRSPESISRPPSEKDWKQALGLDEPPQTRKQRKQKAWQDFQRRARLIQRLP